MHHTAMKIFTLFICACGLMLCTGCLTMAAMHAKDHEAYSQYVEQTNQLNTEREKDHLAPVPILTYHEWKWKGSQ